MLSAVVGNVYDDADASGDKTGGDNELGGWTVFLDLDNSGTLNNKPDGTPEPSVETDPITGEYTFNAVSPGLYRVSEIVQAGWTPTAPASQYVTVADSDSKADFFNFAGGDIVGTVWNDINQDRIRDVDPGTGAFTDPGLAGWTVFLDLNPHGGGGTNGIIDLGEPVTVTDEF